MAKKSEYTQLLGRDLFAYQPQSGFENTRIVITGAAGSIGSHLTKTLLEKTKAHLILIDHNEYSLYQLLIDNHPHRSRIEALLSGIQNKSILEKCFHQHRPDIVIHAAAYKQVPVLETRPAAAILNNIYNTEIIYNLSIKFGVEKFIFISTDKAFSASNVLGRSKKIAERLIGSGENSMESLILRFGNVLYSSGSVSELFRNQIRENQKLTLTDPRAIRYFIAPDEASDFILYAMDQELSAAIYYLYQEKQIRIFDLARQMYRKYHQAEPGGDWWEKIGPRPGDVLSEFELGKLKDEGITTHPMIRKIELHKETDPNGFRKVLQDLYKMAVSSCSAEKIKERLNRLSSFNG